MEELKISKEQLIKSYKTSDDYTKKTLEAIFGKEIFVPKDVKERIKTFEDACRELGENHPYVKAYDDVYNCIEEIGLDVHAYLMLRIIVAALNEGWEPQFTEDEYRWYPWFYLYTQQEIDKMSDKERRRCVLRSGNVSYAYSGLAYALAYRASSNSSSSYGARLAFKSEELAAYAGRQFIEIWADFCFKPQEKKAQEKKA